jgi:hypothetical protein
VTSLAPKKALVSDVSTKPLPSNPTTITTATSESHQGGQSEYGCHLFLNGR